MKKKLTSWLQRKTSSNAFIPEIDGFRFVAIATVVLFHLNTLLTRTLYGTTPGADVKNSLLFVITERGGVGVNIFFGISGFILALPFARQRLFDAPPVQLGSYYLRRLTRLEPPYVISLLIFLLVHMVILHEQFGDLFPNFLASLFYLHGIVFDSWSKINPVAWSLEVEVQFYLLAPFLAIVFSIARPVLRRTVIIAVIVASMLHYNYNFEMIEALHLRKSLFMHLHQFLIGFIFADFYLTDWSEPLKKRSYLFDVLGLLSLCSLLVFNSAFIFSVDVIFGIALFILFICLFRGKLMNSIFTNQWIVVIGGMCYSIYLLHFGLIAFLTGAFMRLFGFEAYAANFIFAMILILPVLLFASACFFMLIERPCMDKDWPQKFWNFLTSRKIPTNKN